MRTPTLIRLLHITMPGLLLAGTLVMPAWCLAEPSTHGPQQPVTSSTHPAPSTPAADPAQHAWERQVALGSSWKPARGPGDLSMLLARQTPLPQQAGVLMGVDWAVPVLAGLMGAVAGAVAGGVLTSVVVGPQLPQGYARGGTRLFEAGTAIGALVGGTVAMLSADLVFNPLHLSHVAPARFMGFLVMLPAAVLVGGSALWMMQPLMTLPTPALTALSLLAGFVWSLNWVALPLVAAAVSLGFRGLADFHDGSALWSRQE